MTFVSMNEMTVSVVANVTFTLMMWKNNKNEWMMLCFNFQFHSSLVEKGEMMEEQTKSS
jgi:hypothetical protein